MPSRIKKKKKRGFNLVVVESPGKVAKIQAILGPDYRVLATRGHVFTLPKRGYGFDESNLGGDFEVKYEELPSRKSEIGCLRREAAKARRVIIATDADREGAAIGFHVLDALGIPWETSERAVFFEITRDALARAFDNLEPLDVALYRAQQARRLVDRGVGYLLSPAVRKHASGGKSAGRCQSVALGLVVANDTEALSSSTTPSWRTTLFLSREYGGGRMSTTGGPAVGSEVEAAEVLRRWAGAEFSVIDTPSVSERLLTPPPAFTTSAIQSFAGQYLGLSPKATMGQLQALYTNGHITYHRTDSTALSAGFLHDARHVIAVSHGPGLVHPRAYGRGDAAAGRQEAHEAIRPTRCDVTKVPGAGNALYRLIWSRALATQCRAATVAEATLRLAAVDRGTGARLGVAAAKESTVRDPGFKSVSLRGWVPDEAAEATLRAFTGLSAGDVFRGVVRASVGQHVPPPPLRLSEAGLVKALERVGVGRPSTFSSIVETIQSRGYARVSSSEGSPIDVVTLACPVRPPRSSEGASPMPELERSVTTAAVGAFRRKLVPTAAGSAVHAYLRDTFPEVIDPTFTAGVEVALDRVARGDLDWRSEVRRVWETFSVRARAERGRTRVTPPGSEGTGGQRAVGRDPGTGLTVYAYEGRYGPVVRLGEKNAAPRFAKLPGELSTGTVGIGDALFLLGLPSVVETGTTLHHGRYGFYVARASPANAKPTTRTVPGGYRGARTLTVEAARGLLDSPPRRRKRRRGRKR